MRRGLALAVAALAGCGGDDAPRRAVPAATAPDAAELSCAAREVVQVPHASGSGDAAADVRALLEDELLPYDVVEQLDEGTARVVRAKDVVAVVRFREGGGATVDVCASLTR